MRNRVTGNLKRKLHLVQQEIETWPMINGRKFRRLNIQPETVKKLQQVLSSYFGHLKHASHYRLIERISERFVFLKDLFHFDRNIRIVPKVYPPFVPINLKSQYLWFARRFNTSCLFFRVGKFYEIYGESAEMISRLLGLQLDNVGRISGKPQCGFPAGYLKHYKQKALKIGLSVVVIDQTGFYNNGLRRRAVVDWVQLTDYVNQ